MGRRPDIFTDCFSMPWQRTGKGRCNLFTKLNVSQFVTILGIQVFQDCNIFFRYFQMLQLDLCISDLGYSEEATAVMVELLRTYSDENASEVKDDATNCIISLLGRPNVLIMDFLLALPPVAALQGEPIYQVHKTSCTFKQLKSSTSCFPKKYSHIFVPLLVRQIVCFSHFSFLTSLSLEDLLTIWNSMKRTKILWILVVRRVSTHLHC